MIFDETSSLFVSNKKEKMLTGKIYESITIESTWTRKITRAELTVYREKPLITVAITQGLSAFVIKNRREWAVIPIHFLRSVGH